MTPSSGLSQALKSYTMNWFSLVQIDEIKLKEMGLESGSPGAMEVPHSAGGKDIEEASVVHLVSHTQKYF